VSIRPGNSVDRAIVVPCRGAALHAHIFPSCTTTVASGSDRPRPSKAGRRADGDRGGLCGGARHRGEAARDPQPRKRLVLHNGHSILHALRRALSTSGRRPEMASQLHHEDTKKMFSGVSFGLRPSWLHFESIRSGTMNATACHRRSARAGGAHLPPRALSGWRGSRVGNAASG